MTTMRNSYKTEILDTTSSRLKSLDDVINEYHNGKNNQLEISDGLIEKYNLDIFEGSNSDISSDQYLQDIFYQDATLSKSAVGDEVVTIFGSSTSYNQSNVTSIKGDYILVGLWIILCLITSVLIANIMKKRRRRAKKNRNKIRVQKLYN